MAVTNFYNSSQFLGKVIKLAAVLLHKKNKKQQKVVEQRN